MDCPDSMETYVHRIGRTARFASRGKSLMFLDPSELHFADKLRDKGYELSKIYANPKKQLTIKDSLQQICSESDQIKYLA